MKLGPVRISVIYFIIGFIWIALSDKLLFLFQGTANAELVQLISSGKGLFFVSVTSVLLWQLIRLNNNRLAQSEKQYRLIYEASPIPN